MRRAGYTLLELIIVIAILAIAATLLVPSLVRRDTYAVEAVLRRLVSDVTFAQSDALADQGYRRVYFDPTGLGWSVVRLEESQLGLPFDPDTAEFVRDPLASGEQQMVMDLAADRRYAGVRLEESQLGLPFDPDTAEFVRDPLASGEQQMVMDLAADRRYAGVRLEGIEIDGSRTWITFDPLGGTISEGGVPGTGGVLVVRSDNLTYRVGFDAFTGKISVAAAEDPTAP